ncbi:hypothetical protein GZ998_01050 [Actinomyces sp. 594]|uniref:hypothetical protein n=1 Tax=Actinomyces sp. 594 TaxID=2057793 RepID=UPI001C587D0A|nr:hypothetical protein [Actinomyces sp. 594]MBW3068105.1 hypothetical protein [Actinomyces sp. 594]
MAAYETEDGEPRYGKRLSPEELAAYLREQGIEPPADAEPVRPAGTSAAGSPGAVNSTWQRSHGAPGGVQHAARSSGTEGGPERPRPHRWRAFGVGLVLMLVVAPLLLAVGVMAVVDGSLSRGAPLGEDGRVYLSAGTTAGLYGTSATATSGCSVSDPDGAAVGLDTPEPGVPYATFKADAGGVYRVSCPAGTTGLVVGPTMNLDRVPVSALLVLGAGAAGVAGLVVTVVGAVSARR